MLTLIHKELEDYRHTQAHGAGDAESSTTGQGGPSRRSEVENCYFLAQDKLPNFWFR